MDYVKNITAYYRQKIDNILSKDNSLSQSSSGITRFFFEPDPEKTFNRGFTEYFVQGRTKYIESFDTPKSLGKYMGKVSDVKHNGFTLKTAYNIHNGDGLCFFDDKKQLCGIRINSSENGFYKPSLKQNGDFKKLKKNMRVYRNYDHEFSKLLKTKSAERLISVQFTLKDSTDGFILYALDETGKRAETRLAGLKIKAEKPEQAIQTIQEQLKKTGSSCYNATDIIIETSEIYFIKKSDLNRLRRNVIEELMDQRKSSVKDIHITPKQEITDFYTDKTDYSENISNRLAESFYRKCGVKLMEPAFELSGTVKHADLMTTRHCLLFSLGLCRKETGKKSENEPTCITHQNTRYQLVFDCSNCVMKVKKA